MPDKSRGVQCQHTRTASSVSRHAHPPVNFQSVMDRPDRVRRVKPPSTTMLNTHALQPPSHHASCRRAESDRPRDRARLGLLLAACAWGWITRTSAGVEQQLHAGDSGGSAAARRATAWLRRTALQHTATQACYLLLSGCTSPACEIQSHVGQLYGCGLLWQSIQPMVEPQGTHLGCCPASCCCRC